MISEATVLWLVGISTATFVISLATLPWLVARIPADYFQHKSRTPTAWKNQHPAVRITLLVLKNLLGWVLFAGGFMMLFLPGQGLLTIAMGMVLMDYPGKFAVERKVASIQMIHRGLNWLRAKRNAPPLEL